MSCDAMNSTVMVADAGYKETGVSVMMVKVRVMEDWVLMRWDAMSKLGQN